MLVLTAAGAACPPTANHSTTIHATKQGRLKVRDPRLFDPCSMRRTTDVLKPPEQQRTLPGAGGDSKDRDSYDAAASSSAGVTLLLGRRADGDRGRGRKEESVGGEQVKPTSYGL